MSHPRNKSLYPVVKNFVIVTIFWIALIYLYFFFSWWSLKDFLTPDIFGGFVFSPIINIEILVQGFVFGILYGIVNYITDKSKIRKKSFGAVILIKSLFYLIAIVISMLFVFGVYFVFDIIPVQTVIEFTKQLPPVFIVSIVVYFSLAIIFINLLSQINRKFGQGVLLHMFIGTYHKPRKERRIFMFLDLKNSTGLAEKIGHYNYSRFIQTCIHDLTEFIIRYKAQVYQYVGDEIVLSWPSKTGFNNYYCIELYYAYVKKLNENRKIYLSKFDCLPEFKAGLDEGIITVTEVGDLKREIAYHGEVVNTASRLEKLCNKLNRKILISDRLNKHLPENDFFQKEFIGEFQLRGKGKKEKVYSVKKLF